MLASGNTPTKHYESIPHTESVPLMSDSLFSKTSRIFVFITSFWLLIGCASSHELKVFSSDGCSAFPDGTLTEKALWLNCCQAHDLTYWHGGTRQQRVKADLVLQACVAEAGEPEIAQIMLAGVRVGGTPYLPTGFRWGYGWRYPRLYGPLSEAELAQVARRKAQIQDPGSE